MLPALMAAGSFMLLGFRGSTSFDKILLTFFLLWAAVGVVLGRYDPVRSIGYTIWILFDFFVIVTHATILRRTMVGEGLYSLGS